MDEFSKIEYQTCIELLRYYDQRQVSALQFSAGLSSAVATALLALLQGAQTITVPFLQLVALVSGVTALGLAALLAMMVQTRLYFVYPARQANAIRKAELARLGSGFTENRMYLDTEFPAFKLLSAQSAMLALVCLQVGVYAGVFFFSARSQVALSASGICQAGFLGAAVAIIAFGIAARYLLTRGVLVADAAVHSTGASPT